MLWLPSYDQTTNYISPYSAVAGEEARYHLVEAGSAELQGKI